MNFLGVFTSLADTGCTLESQLQAAISGEQGQEQKNTHSLVTSVFQLPIAYLAEVSNESLHELPEVVARDLELTILTDSESDSTNLSKTTKLEVPEKNMYEHLLQPKTKFARDIIPAWKRHFTTDIPFLEQTQEVILTIPSLDLSIIEEKETKEEDPIHEIWKDIKENDGFLEKYGYLEWSMLSDWNHSAPFLQCLSLCNIMAPVMSFFIPLFILIIPFVLLKFQGIPISVSMYIECLTNIARNHFIGKALMSFQNMTFQNMIYLFGSLALYVLQMYQNTMQCIRFYKNTQYMNDSLLTIKKHVDDSIIKMDAFCTKFGTPKFDRYLAFCKDIQKHREYLGKIQEELSSVCPFECSIFKTTEIGYMMRCFYSLRVNAEYEAGMVYSMGFQGYLENLSTLSDAFQKGEVGLATFDSGKEIVEIDLDDEDSDHDSSTDSEEDSDVEDLEEDLGEKEKPKKKQEKDKAKAKTVPKPKCFILEQAYLPHVFSSNNPVKNDANLDKKIIITGPNASGKTTFLKTTAINLILSQQFGMGVFKTAHFKPYTHFHSYLNIPDTSGRDSLFQAESRRCKEILDVIKQSATTSSLSAKEDHHFCIFDELYSGTNPKEATKSAYAFLKYLSETHAHVDFILTTHYVSICEKWNKKSDIIQNYKMCVLPFVSSDSPSSEGKYQFTYKIAPGISKIEGAIQILENMEYPDEMLETIRNTNFA
jgi:hypothetical protein